MQSRLPFNTPVLGRAIKDSTSGKNSLPTTTTKVTMRQFTRHTTHSKHQHDDYWKLQSYGTMTAQQMRELLQKRNYPIGKSDSKDKLEEALLRSDCGMQSYADKSDDDLRALIMKRGVDASHVIRGNKVGSRGDLLALLKNADMDPKFERFSDLAPELRNKVEIDGFISARHSLIETSLLGL